MLRDIITGFGLNADQLTINRINSGLINATWKLENKDQAYVLQQVNTDVFKSPETIAANLGTIEKYLKEKHPEYPFINALKTRGGNHLQYTSEGSVYRLMPFVADSHTINVVSSESEAYEAARQFGKFTSILASFDPGRLKPSIPDFHNLLLRFDQFNLALLHASPERIQVAAPEIKMAQEYQDIVDVYQSVRAENRIPLRVIHHDTKISNVLFDQTDRGICVIDLDTVMAGYFFSDLGDMMRTYLSPANEEEKDLSKVTIRKSYFKAVLAGYLSEMASVLTDEEMDLVIYSGEFLIYMQALRFLTDYLNNDVYYTTSYPNQNLTRARNQFRLLQEYKASEEAFTAILRSYLNEV